MSFLVSCVRRASEAATGASEDFCISLESTQNSDCWTQLTAMCINAPYPFSDHPADVLPNVGVQIPASFELQEWEPNEYVTFDHDAENYEEIGGFARTYLRIQFDVPDDESAFRIDEFWR